MIPREIQEKSKRNPREISLIQEIIISLGLKIRYGIIKLRKLTKPMWHHLYAHGFFIYSRPF